MRQGETIAYFTLQEEGVDKIDSNVVFQIIVPWKFFNSVFLRAFILWQCCRRVSEGNLSRFCYKCVK